MALVMVSRTAEFNGNMRTECVKKMNGLFDTENEKRTQNNQNRFNSSKLIAKNYFFCYFCHIPINYRLISRCLPIVFVNQNFFAVQIFDSCAITLMSIVFDCKHHWKKKIRTQIKNYNFLSFGI